MNKYFNQYSIRINRFNLIIILFGALILSKYFFIQFKTNTYLDSIIDDHGYKYRKSIGQRGKILDSNNNELANTINKYTLWVNTNIENESERLIEILAKAFKKDKSYYENKLIANRSYIVLEKDLNDNQYNKIIEFLDVLKGCGLQIEFKKSRIYKYNEFASQTVGFINTEGNGVLGIEKKFNEILSGDTLEVTLKKGAKGNFYNQDFLNNNSIDGKNIQLTIDIEIQKIVQEEIQKMVTQANAKSGNGILIDPNNGHIIAMASIPDFDPNHYNQFDLESFKNRVISDSYEPGSTLKIVPLVLSFESNKFSLGDSIFCEEGEFLLANNRKLHDHEAHGTLSVEDIMAYSSNIGFAKISDSFSDNSLYKFLKYFGFGTKTFISLNSESKGFIRKAIDWSHTSKNYISIGQEVAITNLQLALAYSAIANGGILLKPSIIKKITSNENSISNNNVSKIRRIMNMNTAESIMQSLDKVIEVGTGKELDMNNYKVVGKTGTAQKSINGEYSSFTSTFVSIFPKDYPQYVLVVTIDEPEYGFHWASKSAVPVSKEIIKRMLIADNELHYAVADNQIKLKKIVELNNSTEIKKESDTAFPDLRGKTFKEALKIASEHNVKLVPHENLLSGIVVYQSIKAGLKTKPGMTCSIKMKIL